MNSNTASLRSSSRKNKKRSAAINSGYSSSSKKNSNKPQNNQNKVNQKTIGNSSTLEIHCKGCKNFFRLYKNHNEFITRHVKSNDLCPSYYPRCPFPCNKIFYDTKNLIMHQRNSKKNTSCFTNFQQYQVNSQFTSTEVNIPKTMKLHNDNQGNIPSHMKPYYDYSSQLMTSKQHFDYSKFMNPSKFTNLNHHINQSKGNYFFPGHAVMNPTELQQKQNVNSFIAKKN